MKKTFRAAISRLSMKQAGAIFVMLLACSPAAADPAAPAQNLVATYLQALDTNPVLKGSKASLESDQASRRIARSALMPRINGSGGVSRAHEKITGFGANLGAPAQAAAAASGPIIDTFYARNYSVTLNQPVINGQAWAGLQAAGAQVRAGRAAVLAAEQDLMLQVIEAYFGVLNAQASQCVAAGQVQLLKEILDQAAADLKVGSGDIISLREAQARYDAAVSADISARNAVEISRQQLQRLTHQPVGRLSDLGALQPQGPEPDSAELWSRSAQEFQPLLAQARAQLQAAQDQVEIARRARWPNVSLAAGHGYNKGTFLPSVETRQSQIGLMLNVPIYEGGEISAQVAKAQAQASATGYRLDDLQDQIDLNTRRAFLVLKNSVSRYQAEAQALDSAKTSLAATRKGYAIGSRSIIDLLTSAQDFENVQRDYYQARYEHVLARARLKWATGIISQADVEAINSLLAPQDR